MKRQIAEMTSFLLLKTVLPIVRILLPKQEDVEKIKINKRSRAEELKIEEENIVTCFSDCRRGFDW
jgi:hypothetical protein